MQGPFLTTLLSTDQLSTNQILFVTEKYNDGCDVPAKFVNATANDILFDPLPSNEHKTDVKLQRKWKVMSKSLHDILISSQVQTILKEISFQTRKERLLKGFEGFYLQRD
jgi:hypothetical protein